ncbi:unnamed protein product [Linum trigynum]|uniref:CWF21 domain-containing protein n=2 Tax=Linum trigynum TaxID=586398 RepID=A0AAV2CMH1_9ROSI
MYNGIGLQTARGSGTNGYIQTNRFFVRPRTDKVAHASRGFDEDQGTAGISKKPNKDILEHDRKRQIQLKLVVLEDKLIEQGYTDAEIAEKMEEARKTLEAASASEGSGGPTSLISGDAKISNTQSHQVAARKERQMETLRAALGIQSTDPNKDVADLSDVGPFAGGKNDGSKWIKKPEHAFLDRDFKLKKDAAEDLDIDKRAAGAAKSRKKVEEADEAGQDRRAQAKRKKRHHGSESDISSNAEEGEVTRGKHRKVRRGSSDADSDSDYGKKNRVSKKHRKGRRHRKDSDDSDSGHDTESDDGKKKNSDYADSDSDYGKKNRVSKKHRKGRRHRKDSYDSESGHDTDSDDGRKKISDKHTTGKHGRKRDGSSYDDDTDSDNAKKKKKPKKNGIPRKPKKIRSGSESDDSSADDSEGDDGKNNPKVQSEKRRKSQRRHDIVSDSDSDFESEPSRHRLGETRQHAKTRRRPDSDADVSAKRKNTLKALKGSSDGNQRREKKILGAGVHLKNQDSDVDNESGPEKYIERRRESAKNGDREHRRESTKNGADYDSASDGSDDKKVRTKNNEKHFDGMREGKRDLDLGKQTVRRETGRGKKDNTVEEELDSKLYRDKDDFGHDRYSRSLKSRDGISEKVGDAERTEYKGDESPYGSQSRQRYREGHGRENKGYREERDRYKKDSKEEWGRDRSHTREERESDQDIVRKELGRDDWNAREERGRDKQDPREEHLSGRRDFGEEHGREKRDFMKEHGSGKRGAREDRQSDKRDIREERGRDTRENCDSRDIREERGRDKRHAGKEEDGHRTRRNDKVEQDGEKRKSFTDNDDVQKHGTRWQEREEEGQQQSKDDRVVSSKRARYVDDPHHEYDRRRDNRRDYRD